MNVSTKFKVNCLSGLISAEISKLWRMKELMNAVTDTAITMLLSSNASDKKLLEMHRAISYNKNNWN